MSRIILHYSKKMQDLDYVGFIINEQKLKDLEKDKEVKENDNR